MCGMLRVILTSKAPKQGWLQCLHRLPKIQHASHWGSAHLAHSALKSPLHVTHPGSLNATQLVVFQKFPSSSTSSWPSPNIHHSTISKFLNVGWKIILSCFDFYIKPSEVQQFTLPSGKDGPTNPFPHMGFERCPPTRCGTHGITRFSLNSRLGTSTENSISKTQKNPCKNGIIYLQFAWLW